MDGHRIKLIVDMKSSAIFGPYAGRALTEWNLLVFSNEVIFTEGTSVICRHERRNFTRVFQRFYTKGRGTLCFESPAIR